MNKISKLTLLVSSVLTTQAFAFEVGDAKIDVYAKGGFTSQLDGNNDEVGKNEQVHANTNDDFSGYEDSKVVVKLDYDFNKNFGLAGEVKSFYEGQGDDYAIRMQELYAKFSFGDFDAEVGRMRTPLYMKSVHQDDDFALNTYRGVRGFSTAETALETLDGGSVAYTSKTKAIKSEVRFIAGVAKNRDQYGYLYTGANRDAEASGFETSAEDVYGLTINSETKFGDFRAAAWYARLSDPRFGFIAYELDTGTGAQAHEGLETVKADYSLYTLGYSVNKGKFFADAEIALETLDDTEFRKGYVTTGLKLGNLIPSVTYSQTEVEFTDVEDSMSVETALTYHVNDNIRLKAAYEYLEYRAGNGHRDSFSAENLDDQIVSLGVAVKF